MKEVLKLNQLPSFTQINKPLHHLNYSDSDLYDIFQEPHQINWYFNMILYFINIVPSDKESKEMVQEKFEPGLQ